MSEVRDGALFRNAVGGFEAVLEVLGVLVAGVFGEHLARGGALEGLEARLALDAKGRDVLCHTRLAHDGVNLELAAEDTYRLQLAFALLGTLCGVALPLLRCPSTASVSRNRGCGAGVSYFAPLPMLCC